MRAILLLAALPLWACDTGFRPESLVANLRVLAVRADPPELHPGETARIDSLVLDPSRPGQRSTVLWIGCAPDPFNENRSACSDPAVLSDPSSLTDGTGQLPPGVTVLGLGTTAAYTAPAGLFDVLPAEDARRQVGTVAQLLAVAAAEEVAPTATSEDLQALFERVQRREVRSLITLFRLRLDEAAERNHNPVFTRLFVAGEAWPRGAHVQVLPGERVVMDAEVTPESYERYTSASPSDAEPQTERILAAWYSTAGRYTEDRTALGESVKTVFTAPGVDPQDPLPDRRTGTLWVVLRDTRGGQTWQEVPFFVCDSSLPSPQVSSVHAPANAAEPLVLTGTNLDSILDVVIDGVAVDGGFRSETGTWEGLAPPGFTSAQALLVFTKTCDRFSSNAQ